ncbi:MAG: hypothetical protein ACRDJ4_14930 [Actinomycetota bacterium]
MAQGTGTNTTVRSMEATGDVIVDEMADRGFASRWGRGGWLPAAGATAGGGAAVITWMMLRRRKAARARRRFEAVQAIPKRLVTEWRKPALATLAGLLLIRRRGRRRARRLSSGRF